MRVVKINKTEAEELEQVSELAEWPVVMSIIEQLNELGLKLIELRLIRRAGRLVDIAVDWSVPAGFLGTPLAMSFWRSQDGLYGIEIPNARTPRKLVETSEQAVTIVITYLLETASKLREEITGIETITDQTLVG